MLVGEINKLIFASICKTNDKNNIVDCFHFGNFLSIFGIDTNSDTSTYYRNLPHFCGIYFSVRNSDMV